MNSTSLQSRFALASQTRGVISTVARALGLSHEHVRQVAYGRRVSARVEKALLAELRKRERVLNRERAA